MKSRLLGAVCGITLSLNATAIPTTITFDSYGVDGPFTTINSDEFVFTSNPSPTGTINMFTVQGEIGCSPDCPDNDTTTLL